MRKTKSIVRDGHNYTALIPAKDGEYGELEIRYRPILPEEVDTVFEKRDQGTAAYHVAVREAMVAHIEEWSEWDDAKNQMVPITSETLKRLPQGLFWSLWNQLFNAIELEQAEKN